MGALQLGDRKAAQTFFNKVSREPFGSWPSAPKIVDAGTKKWGFLRPGDGEKLFDPWASGRKRQECPQEIRAKKFTFFMFFNSLYNGGLINSPHPWSSPNKLIGVYELLVLSQNLCASSLSANSRKRWLFLGSVQGFPMKTPDNCGKIS